MWCEMVRDEGEEGRGLSPVARMLRRAGEVGGESPDTALIRSDAANLGAAGPGRLHEEPRAKKGYKRGEVSDKYRGIGAFPVDSTPARVTAFVFGVLDGQR